jgi:hypothetical protein
VEVIRTFTKGANNGMAKDRIERDELASKLLETASSAEDPMRALAELVTDFLMEAEVTARIGAEPHERSEEQFDDLNSPRPRRCLVRPLISGYPRTPSFRKIVIMGHQSVKAD